MSLSYDRVISIDSALEETERRGEFIAAVFRLLISAVMFVAVWLLVPSAPTSHPIFLVAVGYGLTSIVGLGLAMRRLYHPVLPFVYVAIDCVIVALSITLLARMRGMGMSTALSLPLFSLGFVILIHAALRYRPRLVAFAAVLFVGLVLAVPVLIGAGNAVPSRPMVMTAAERLATSGADGRAMPLMFFGLGAVLLFYIVRRTKGLAKLALLDGKRVAQLARFFSPEIAGRLVSQDYLSGAYGARQKVAILFIDIRGFTRLAETMPPEELTEFLSSFRNEVCKTIFAHGGTVDKFIGDAVLAVFGTPTTATDDPRRAFDAALAVSGGVWTWFLRRKKIGEAAALVGIGAHFGEVFAGVIESGEILEHTIIGDSVNVAQRLERLSRDLESSLVISRDLIDAAGVDPAAYGLRCMERTALAGHGAPITVYHDELGSLGGPPATTC